MRRLYFHAFTFFLRWIAYLYTWANLGTKTSGVQGRTEESKLFLNMVLVAFSLDRWEKLSLLLKLLKSFLKNYGVSTISLWQDGDLYFGTSNSTGELKSVDSFRLRSSSSSSLVGFVTFAFFICEASFFGKWSIRIYDKNVMTKYLPSTLVFVLLWLNFEKKLSRCTYSMAISSSTLVFSVSLSYIVDDLVC